MRMTINFSAGPAALPRAAVLRAREDLVDFEGTGLSVIEQSHRGAAYEKVQAGAISLVRDLLAVPDSHEILLLQGGARGQFAMLAHNLITPGTFGDYVVTGLWARAAYDEAVFTGRARIAADTREPDGSYRRVPRPEELPIGEARARGVGTPTALPAGRGSSPVGSIGEARARGVGTPTALPAGRGASPVGSIARTRAESSLAGNASTGARC